MKKYAFLALTACLVLGASLLAAAQVESVTIQGTVVDQQGQAVADAVVAFHGANTGLNFSVKSDKKGEFLKIGARSDAYHITVTKDGQQIGEMNNVSFTYGTNPPLKITITKPAAAAPPAPSVPLNAAEKQALEDLKKQAAAAPKKDDKVVKEKLQAAQAAIAANNFDQALAILTELTAMDPMNDGAWALMGFSYAKTGKNDLAAVALEKAVALNPGFGGYHQNLAIAYAKMEKIDQGLAELDSAGKVDPANAARYYLYSGLLLAQERQTGPAVAAYDKAIAADPSLADAYYFKGLTLMDQAQEANGKVTVPPGTVEAFKKYLELQPNGPRAASAKEALTKLGG